MRKLNFSLQATQVPIYFSATVERQEIMNRFSLFSILNSHCQSHGKEGSSIYLSFATRAPSLEIKTNNCLVVIKGITELPDQKKTIALMGFLSSVLPSKSAPLYTSVRELRLSHTRGKHSLR